MNNYMSTGQITLIDLTDERPNSFYLWANQSKIQTYDVNTEIWSPDYTQATGAIVITPEFLFGNQTQTIGASHIIYKVNGIVAQKYASKEAGVGAFYQVGAQLFIVQNIGAEGTVFEGESQLRVYATIAEGSLTDSETGLPNKEIDATIDFALLTSGADGASGAAGVSISEIKHLYFLSQKSTSDFEDYDASEGTVGWLETPHSWKKDTYMWQKTKFIYLNPSDNTTWFTESAPYCDTSWKIASDGVFSINEQLLKTNELIDSLQKEVDGAIESWYQKGNPNELANRPWYDASLEVQDTDASHIGDLYFNTEDGKSYRFLQDGEIYKWALITDSDLSVALQNIDTLRTDVDNKVKIYYGEDPGVANVRIDDLWVDSNGVFKQCVGDIAADGTQSNKSWSIASASIKDVVVQYIVWGNDATGDAPPETHEDWDTVTPTWQNGKYIWQRIVTSYADPDKKPTYSSPTCLSAAAPRSVSISGEQVFKISNGAATPKSIALKIDVIGQLRVTEVQYRKNILPSGVDEWTKLSGFLPGNTSFSINPDGPYFKHTKADGTQTDTDIAVFQLIVQDSITGEATTITDKFSVYKIYDGINGTNGTNGTNGVSPSIAFLTNESIGLPSTNGGVVARDDIVQLLQTSIVAYQGTTKVLPTVKSVSYVGVDSNLLTYTASQENGQINYSFNIASAIGSGTNFGGASVNAFSIQFAVATPINTTLTLNVVKQRQGSTGAAAMVGIVESQTGKFAFSDSEPDDITLKATLYSGSTALTSGVEYNWSTIPESTLTVGNSQTLTVSRGQVQGVKSFACTMKYNGKSYNDGITIFDHTDPIQCVISSSKGTQFTNHNIETVLTCQIFNSTQEIDSNGTGYVYTWEKFDKDGIKDTGWIATPYPEGAKTNKSILITSDHISSKAIFSCKVNKAG